MHAAAHKYGWVSMHKIWEGNKGLIKLGLETRFIREQCPKRFLGIYKLVNLLVLPSPTCSFSSSIWDLFHRFLWNDSVVFPQVIWNFNPLFSKLNRLICKYTILCISCASPFWGMCCYNFFTNVIVFNQLSCIIFFKLCIWTTYSKYLGIENYTLNKMR